MLAEELVGGLVETGWCDVTDDLVNNSEQSH